MKKVISLALCLMMLASMFAISANASVIEHKKIDEVNVYYRYAAEKVDGADVDFATSQLSSANGATAIVTDDGTGNDVIEFAWNGTGADDKTRLYALYAIPGSHMITGWDSSDMANFTFTLDVKPINNVGGFGLSLHKPVKRIGFFPSVLPTGEWTTLKVVWDNSKLSIFAKAQDANDSAYKELVAGTDYYESKWVLSNSSTIIGVDRSIADPDAYGAKYDLNNFKTAKYLVDNIKINRIRKVSYKGNEQYNCIFYTDAETKYEFNTADGAGKVSYTVPVVWLPGSKFTMAFDAVRTGGDRAIDIAYCSNPYDGSCHAINLFSGEQDVNYTYKVDFNGASILKAVRKAENSDTWEVLTAGVDYSAGSIHGAKSTYLKFNYLGDYYADKADKLAEYCGPNYETANLDVDTKWTIGNLQISNGVGTSAIIEKTESGSVVTVSAVGGVSGAAAAEDNFTVMVAAYRGDLMLDAGVAEINYEGDIDIVLEHEHYSELNYKLFAWDNDENGAPLMNVIDITSWVK